MRIVRSGLAAIIILVVTLVTPSLLYGQYVCPFFISDTENFHCNVATGANDLHITYTNAQGNPMTLEGHEDGVFSSFDWVSTSNGSVYNCKWSGTELSYCEWSGNVGVKFNVCDNQVSKSQIRWTKNGVPVGTELPGSGFGIAPWTGTGSITYTVENSTSVPFTINGLSFRISTEPVSLHQMIYPMPGFGPPRADPVYLGPGESWDTTFSPGLDVTYYVMAQGEIEGDEGQQSDFCQQHEHPIREDIPTLTEWGLTIFGVLLLGFITWVFLKRRKLVDVRT